MTDDRTPSPSPSKPRRRFVDLSIYLENDVLSDPPPLAPKITYQKHADTLPEFMAMIPGTRPEDYPDGEAAAAEWVTLTTHNGTHLDAPWHFHSTQDAKNGGARPSITIDEVPLEWCFQPGVKLDFRHLPDGYVATAADVEAELARIGQPCSRSTSWWSIPGRARATGTGTTWAPAAAWATKPPCTCSNAACA